MAQLRIASLLASSTEILYGLGLGGNIVAISHECDYPPEVTSKPRVTFTRIDDKAASGDIDVQVKERMASGAPIYEIDVDRLAELKPDAIVTQAQCEVCAVSLSDVTSAIQSNEELRGARVVTLNANSLGDIFEDIRRVGRGTDRVDAAETYIATLESRRDAVAHKSKSLADADRPRVVCLEWLDPIMVAANWMPELIHWAGGRCDMTQTGSPSGYTAWNDVLDYDPQVIVVMPCGFDLKRTRKESATLPGLQDWSSLSAVKNHRVYAVDGNAFFNRSGPRIIDSLEILAKLIHDDPTTGQLNCHADVACRCPALCAG